MALTQVQGGMVGNSGVATLDGVQFPATQVPSSDPNCLDDYEEGTWTPVLQGSSSAGTYTYDTSRTGGSYTKVGNLVTLRGAFRVNGTTSAGSGQALIYGLPFTPQGNYAAASSWSRGVGSTFVQSGPNLSGTYGSTSIMVCPLDTLTYMEINYQSAGAGSSENGITVADAAVTNSIWSFTVQYRTT